jgi:2-polyprenyl-3-methyl-5-hydroxy-6-metoxy-1,4-benzoquinol methylase
MLLPEGRASHHGTVTDARRYTLKSDPHSSHSIILRWLGEGNGRRALDVGAADGLLSRHLTDRGWRVTALEGDAAAAARGAVHCERMIVADLDRELPPLGGAFDAVVCGDVLEHLVEPSRVLRDLARALTPRGRLILSIPNVAHLWVRLSLLCGKFDYAERGILDRTHLRFFTARTLRDLLATAELVVLRRTVTPAPLPEIVPARWHGPWLDGVHGASAVAARALPRLLGYQFVVLAAPPSSPAS